MNKNYFINNMNISCDYKDCIIIFINYLMFSLLFIKFKRTKHPNFLFFILFSLIISFNQFIFDTLQNIMLFKVTNKPAQLFFYQNLLYFTSLHSFIFLFYLFIISTISYIVNFILYIFIFFKFIYSCMKCELNNYKIKETFILENNNTLRRSKRISINKKLNRLRKELN